MTVRRSITYQDAVAMALRHLADSEEVLGLLDGDYAPHVKDAVRADAAREVAAAQVYATLAVARRP